MAVHELERLRTLAERYGVLLEYMDVHGVRREASIEALLAVLKALGAPLEDFSGAGAAVRDLQESAKGGVPPVLVSWEGRPFEFKLATELPVHCTLKMEDGEELSWFSNHPRKTSREPAVISLPQDVPPGYHHLSLVIGKNRCEALFLHAPSRMYGANGSKRWGVFSPLYALHSRKSWGVGDFSDLRQLSAWSSEQGASFVATLPLLPVSGEGMGSPYLPLSRLFWNELFIDVERVPEFSECAPARAAFESPGFQSELTRLHAALLVDWRGVCRVKRLILAELSKTFFQQSAERRNSFEQFLKTHPEVERYAAFRAVWQREGRPWPLWPESLRAGDLGAESRDSEEQRYHLYVQWLAQEQLLDASNHSRANGQSLYLDLPLGFYPDGYDAWRERDSLVPRVAVGAPPDSFFPKGQNWGFPPLHPQKIQEKGHRYFTEVIRHHLSAAGMLRIDHVMGLHRLFWIPEGFDAKDGVYVRYPWEQLYAILAIESHRNEAIIVGEDLGTVPPEVREAMDERSMRRSYVAQLFVSPGSFPEVSLPPENAMASLNTHDLAPFAAFWKGLDVLERNRLGLTDSAQAEKEAVQREASRQAILQFLHASGRLKGSSVSLEEIFEAFLSFLAESDAGCLLVNLEDLWLEEHFQNIPGTSEEAPNWRHRLRYGIEEFSKDPRVQALLSKVDEARGGKAHGF
ncbi:MAG: 4-alpha-glucanotransferase [Bdellovibrionota bacterium]